MAIPEIVAIGDVWTTVYNMGTISNHYLTFVNAVVSRGVNQSLHDNTIRYRFLKPTI